MHHSRSQEFAAAGHVTDRLGRGRREDWAGARCQRERSHSSCIRTLALCRLRWRHRIRETVGVRSLPTTALRGGVYRYAGTSTGPDFDRGAASRASIRRTRIAGARFQRRKRPSFRGERIFWNVADLQEKQECERMAMAFSERPIRPFVFSACLWRCRSKAIKTLTETRMKNG